MGRPRNPKRAKALALWSKSKGTAKLKDIAAEIGVTPVTVRKWKSEDKWDNTVKRNVPKGVKERSEKMRGNQNAKGGSGGHAPKHNKNAVTHGLFANWLPEDTQNIIDSMQERSPADLVWDQIEIQYAAIIRAQKIMYVADKKDLSNELQSDGAQGETWAVQYAWDKQANFMAAQSRAMSVLSNLIKQYVAMGDADEERKSQLAIMQANVDKAKADAFIANHQVKKIKDGNKSQEDRLADLLGKVTSAVKEEPSDGA